MKAARRIGLIFLSTVALAACSSGSDDGNDVPAGWISSEYGGSGVDYVDSSDATDVVAKEIDGHTAANDVVNDQGMAFLRYRDDIVAITPYLGGSRIEIDDYRTGYSRWNTHVRSVWPDPASDAFRGGGPGEGK